MINKLTYERANAKTCADTSKGYYFTPSKQIDKGIFSI